jgi:hypothetical protein
MKRSKKERKGIRIHEKKKEEEGEKKEKEK